MKDGKLAVCAEVNPPTLSLAMHRVALALRAAAPEWAEMVKDREACDVAVHHVIGLTGLRELMAADRAGGRRSALVQYCLRTTEDSRAETWLPIWRDAALVWSYYDLEKYVAQADIRALLEAVGRADISYRSPTLAELAASKPWPEPEALAAPVGFHFYHAPMGVDGGIFYPAAGSKKFTVGTSGYVAESEAVRECYDAAVARTGGRMFHLGPNQRLGEGVTYAHHIPDAKLAECWSACRYVAGLRRGEGFELPALEGLACGARAVCFDAPHYRDWFGEHAEYVPEADAAAVTDALEALFRGPYRQVTPQERDHVARQFSWARIAEGFWAALAESLQREGVKLCA